MNKNTAPTVASPATQDSAPPLPHTHDIPHAPRPRTVIVTLGCLQILAWGSSFYLLGVLAKPIAGDTGWPSAFVVGGLSLALLVAGLVSPQVGRVIHARGGRPVLATSSLLFATGLALLALAPALPIYLAAWAVIGLGMACGLYDPAFATLGRQYGHDARQMITAVTLFGGFASTAAWPLSALLLERFGWREACAAYALLHAAVGLPAYLLLLPKRPPQIEAVAGRAPPSARELPRERQTLALVLLGLSLTVGAATLSLVSMHLLALLQARGLTLAIAVGLGALVGPSQVGARVIEMAVGRHFHPVWTMLAGTVLVAAGIVLLWTGAPIVAAALIAYGAGNGISSIVRGTVPLMLFGPTRYAVLMGRLGFPILLAMAAAPTAGAMLIDLGGAPLTFGVLSAASLLNVALALVLVWWCKRSALG